MFFVPMFNIQIYDRMRDILSITMMQVATRFERRQNNAKNNNVVLYKVQMCNAY